VEVAASSQAPGGILTAGFFDEHWQLGPVGVEEREGKKQGLTRGADSSAKLPSQGVVRGLRIEDGESPRKAKVLREPRP